MSATEGIDLYGSCVCCHKEMLTTRVVDVPGKGMEERSWLMPEYTELKFKLDDGSIMRVAICRTCKVDVEEQDYKTIMKTVFNGWKKETKELVNQKKWTNEKRDKYLEKYGELKIDKRLYDKDEKLKKVNKKENK